MPSKRRVVITGYGMITPLGRNARETFDQCARGASGIGLIKAFDSRGFPCQVAGQIPDEWADDAVCQNREGLLRYSSRGTLWMGMATREAAAQARLQEVSNRDRVGVSIGSYGENPTIEDICILHRFYDGKGSWDLEGLKKEKDYDAFTFFRRKPDMAPAIMAALLDCRGPNLSMASACAAGSQAIGEAFRLIQDGKSDVMIAGGCEATVTLTGFLGFILLGALATRYETPQQASRPFDRKRNGFVLSEGAGALILEDFDHARERGIPMHGEILGYGVSSDAYRITDTHPQGRGAVLAMQKAMTDAQLSPDDIGYINAHGTSTPKNDLSETKAIKEVFGSRAREIPISANKSMLGHAIAAAGPVELVLTLMGMNESIILPTINQEFPDPGCDLWYVPNQAIQHPHGVALSNSFAFGGQNACLCVGSVR